MRVPGIPRSKNATTLVKESTLVAVSQLITIALGFITLLLLGKGLSLEDFGRYQFLLAIVASCQLLTLSGYGVVLTKAVFDGNDSALVTAVKHSLTAGVIIFCPLAAVGWKGAELGYIDESTTQMIFFVATLSILSPFDKLSDYLVAKRKFTRSRAIIVLQALLTCILVGGAATWYGTIFPVLIATVVAKAMTHCLAIPLTLSVFKRASVKEHSTHDKALFIQAAKYTAVSSTSVAATQIDRIMLGLLDESALAIYVMGSYIPKRVKDNFKVIASVATTYLGQKTQGEYISLLSRYRLKFNILSYTVVAALTLASCLILHFAFPESGQQALWVCVALFILMPQLFFCTFIAAFDTHKTDGAFFRRLNLIRSLIYITLVMILGREFGIYGILSSLLLVDIVYIYALRRHFTGLVSRHT